MKPATKNLLRGVLKNSMISAGITMTFMYLFYVQAWQSLAAGFFIGALIPAILNLYSDLIQKRYFRRMNLILLLLVNTLVNVFVLVVVAGFFVVVFYMRGDFSRLADPHFYMASYFISGIGFGILLALLFNFFTILNNLIGQKILGKLFIGMYRQPKEVERVFMFLDLKSSTAMAERMGHAKFLSLVNDFFYDLTEPVRISKGEIYKYVGDEVIVSWKLKDAFKNAACIRCYFEIRETINRKQDFYQKRYGEVPDFRAGLHGGIAITGELGQTKREIAFMGDVVNTTARIMDACKTYNTDLLISDYLVKKINNEKQIETHEVGEVVLRGKTQAVKLFNCSVSS